MTKRTLITKPCVTLTAAALCLALAGCGEAPSTTQPTSAEETTQTDSAAQPDSADQNDSAGQTDSATQTDEESDLYTARDLRQEADTSDATYLEVQSGQDVSITEEGVYVLSGTASDVTITVDVETTQKVQLVLDGLNVTNSDLPVIYVASADKVFVTTADGSQNTLTVTGTFASIDGETSTDAVIFSKDDLVLNGLGTLAISSSDNAVAAKDDLKVTGGTYSITCAGEAFDVNDAAYFYDGTFEIEAQNDAIRSDELVQIDGGTYAISAREGIESTYVLINDGTMSIEATDDGINAGQKSDAHTPTIEIAGGSLTITMAEGDTDALDANGNILISGGTVSITAQFAFDFDGTAELTGGTVYVNGEQVTAIENSMMMGGPGGGRW